MNECVKVEEAKNYKMKILVPVLVVMWINADFIEFSVGESKA